MVKGEKFKLNDFVFVMALSPIFSDYFEEYGMKIPEEEQNFIVFEGKITSVPKARDKNKVWEVKVKALSKATTSFKVFEENLKDVFSDDDDATDNLIVYDKQQMDKLYKLSSTSKNDSSDASQNSNSSDGESDNSSENSEGSESENESDKQESVSNSFSVLDKVDLSSIMSPKATNVMAVPLTSTSLSNSSSIATPIVQDTSMNWDDIDGMFTYFYGGNQKKLKHAPTERHREILLS